MTDEEAASMANAPSVEPALVIPDAERAARRALALDATQVDAHPAFAPLQAGAQTIKTEVTGWVQGRFPLEFGDTWLSGPIFHERGSLYQ